MSKQYNMSYMANLEEIGVSEMYARAKKSTPYLYDGFVSRGRNLLYGEAKSGKSLIAVDLVASLVSGKPFMSTPIADQYQGTQWKVAILGSDDFPEEEYGERLEKVLPDAEDMGYEFATFPVSSIRDYQEWIGIRNQLHNKGYNFVILDNLTQLAGGDINSPVPVQEFWEGVKLFTEARIHTVTIAHSSDSENQFKQKSEKPGGHYAITAGVRHRMFVVDHGDFRTVKTIGNHQGSKKVHIVETGDVPDFTVKQTMTYEEFETFKRARSKTRKAERAKMDEPSPKKDRNRGTDHATRVKDFLSGKDWVKKGTIQAGVRGTQTVISAALDSLVGSSEVQQKPGDGGSILYRLAS